MAQRPTDPAAKPSPRHAPALRDPLEAALEAGRREPKRRLKPKARAKGKAAVRRAAKKTAKSLAKKTRAKGIAGPAAQVRPKPKAHPVSPLAPKAYPAMPPIRGVTLAAGEAGIRYQGRTDLLLATFVEGTAAAGVFTTSKSASAPVEWCRKALDGGRARGLVVNSGNANAFTGAAGAKATRETARAAAKLLDAEPGAIFLASTGVIGEPLPYEKLTAALPALAKAQRGDAFMAAARAIMTTDTFPKAATRTATIDGVTVTINGIAKGSGMIAPDLATMLAFVFTDAKITPAALQTLLLLGVRDSFNCITVDSDTSTSDTVLAFATGLAGNDEISRPGDRRLASFKEALDDLLLELALLVVKDGEGARKLIQVDVAGAESPKAAKVIAMAIANSPLVKTAVAGEDANWGRVVMAVGKAGEAADRDRLTIRFGPHVVAKNGQRASDYDEAKVSAYVRGDTVEIGVDLGLGRGTARVWTCDLTEGYIRINGSYRS